MVVGSLRHRHTYLVTVEMIKRAYTVLRAGDAMSFNLGAESRLASLQSCQSDNTTQSRVKEDNSGEFSMSG